MTVFKPKVDTLIDMMANPLEKRSKEALAEACGFHPKTVYRLQKQPEFQEAVRERMHRYVGTNLPRVFATLFQLVEDKKSIKAAELLLKAAGELGGPAVNVTTNVTQRTADEATEDLSERAAEILRRRSEALDEQPRQRSSRTIKPDEELN
jgi:hypothetical protein